MLEGTLESFTLPDIFQLLAATNKSGCLRLSDDDQTGRVYFRDGDVYYAVSSTGGMALGRRLVGAGVVSTEELASALEAQKSGRFAGQGLRLGQVLVDEGSITSEELEVFVREQIQDAVFDLMRWSSGSFNFIMPDDAEGDEAAIDEPIELTVTVENLIMEGSRRIDEWETVRKKIPTMDAVVAMAPRASEGGVEMNLEPEEWRLLTMVDGRRTVGDLVRLFGQGEFQTVKVLYGLVGAGLLEVRDPELEGPPSIASLLQQHELLERLEAETGELTAPRIELEEAEETPETAETEIPLEPEEAHQPEAEAAPPDEEPEVEEEEAAPPGQRLTTDPEIDEDLVRRLIAGVKGL